MKNLNKAQRIVFSRIPQAVIFLPCLCVWGKICDFSFPLHTLSFHFLLWQIERLRRSHTLDLYVKSINLLTFINYSHQSSAIIFCAVCYEFRDVIIECTKYINKNSRASFSCLGFHSQFTSWNINLGKWYRHSEG